MAKSVCLLSLPICTYFYIFLGSVPLEESKGWELFTSSLFLCVAHQVVNGSGLGIRASWNSFVSMLTLGSVEPKFPLLEFTPDTLAGVLPGLHYAHQDPRHPWGPTWSWGNKLNWIQGEHQVLCFLPLMTVVFWLWVPACSHECLLSLLSLAGHPSCRS